MMLTTSNRSTTNPCSYFTGYKECIFMQSPWQKRKCNFHEFVLTGCTTSCNLKSVTILPKWWHFPLSGLFLFSAVSNRARQHMALAHLRGRVPCLDHSAALITLVHTCIGAWLLFQGQRVTPGEWKLTFVLLLSSPQRFKENVEIGRVTLPANTATTILVSHL